ncbi:MAG: metallophosphoesterase family protein [Chloroherpetonaceae bacterium]|nr:serine/threonine protein phosphatase [Chloroherpetonaceae bacterium]MCS7212573.1 serine/threonine protein phosphatase [Chloroherpetonaceae bacterium]MDW8019285.1 metallophosphoesterase family protein [Chloroherpetonaceae bacterium]
MTHLPTAAAQKFIAIGDIHGCLQPLQALLDKLSPASDEILVFLGDYIDRGPDSKGVIDYLLELREKHPCVFLMGNHEFMMLEYLDFGREAGWSLNGGQSTLDSYTVDGQVQIPDSHIEFLHRCVYYYDTDQYFFVHGGLKPTRSIADNLKLLSPLDLLWEREHLSPHHLFYEDYAWEKTVVCGHTPRPEPILKEKLISIDTGCVYNYSPELGRLTAIRLPSLQLTQVDNRAQKFSFSGWLKAKLAGVGR